jgi:peptide/nickel transport system substrate-binding protein
MIRTRCARAARLVAGVGLAVLLCATLATAARPSGVAGKPTLRIGETIGVNPDPRQWYDNIETSMWVYEGPLHWKSDGTVGPSLATSWRWLKVRGSHRANQDFEFTLRHNARFSDGTTVTAQAVKGWYLYKEAYNKKLYGAAAATLQFGVPLQSVQTVGKWTVIIHLEEPNPLLPSYFLGFVQGGTLLASPACVSHPAFFKNHSCGAGPYMVDFSQTLSGDHVTLVPNPYYYDKSKQVWGTITIKSVAVPTSLLQGLQAGQFDFVEGDPSTAVAAGKSGFTVVHAPAFNLTMVPNYNKVKAFGDIRVRQAMNYALDRNALSKAYGHGFTTPTAAFPTSDGLTAQTMNYYPYNPAKAKALLAAAGHSHDLSISILSWSPFGSVGTPLIQAIATYYAKVGIKVKVVEANTIADLSAKDAAVDVVTNPFGLDFMFISYGIFLKTGSRAS